MRAELPVAGIGSVLSIYLLSKKITKNAQETIIIREYHLT